MPSSQTEKNWEKFDAVSKWSGDLDYINRFNFFIGNAASNIAEAYSKSNLMPDLLLDAVFQMEQAFMDARVLMADEKSNELEKGIVDLQVKLIEDLPGAVAAKANGNPTDFFNLRVAVNQKFMEVREFAHKAGLTIKADVKVGSLKDRLQSAIAPPIIKTS